MSAFPLFCVVKYVGVAFGSNRKKEDYALFSGVLNTFYIELYSMRVCNADIDVTAVEILLL